MEAGERSDEDLLTAARGGERPALESLVRRYQARIYGYGLRMCGDPEDARDVLQDTMLAMARRIDALEAAAALPTWLYTVARRFCLKRRRGAPRPQSLDAATAAGLQVSDPGRGPEERVAGRELEAALAAAIAALPAAQREVLVLRDLEGFPAAQVADILGIRVAAVKSRLHRARATLRDALAPALGAALPEAPAAARCPDVVTLWSRHEEGEITPSLCARMEAHVSQCPRCAAACDSLKRTLALCQSAPSPHVPESVQRSLRAELATLSARAG